MSNDSKKEVWLRGPLPGMPGLLQPVAHALLQAREEVNELMNNFPDELLWERLAGTASPGFHLQHMAGVLDRLSTYANAQLLSEEQLNALSKEEQPSPQTNTVVLLVKQFNRQVDRAIEQLKNTSEDLLLQSRGVGRAQIPSTVLGLLVHAAEHTMRHLGQLIVTARILKTKAG
jgi:uncharacterized damage-inducible protein DinB